jgi:hypothetical protein
VSFGGLYFNRIWTGIEGIRLPDIDIAAKSTNFPGDLDIIFKFYLNMDFNLNNKL